MNAALLRSVVLVSVLSQVAAGAQDYVLRGTYQKKTYLFGDAPIVFFSFTYSGKLNANEVSAVAQPLLDRLVKERVSTDAVKYTWRSDFGAHPGLFALASGSVFVVGWLNLSTSTWGWLAVDRDNQTFPDHRWLSNSGKSGSFGSSTIGGTNAVSQTWKPSSSSPKGATISVRSESGWLGWYIGGDFGRELTKPELYRSIENFVDSEIVSSTDVNGRIDYVVRPRERPGAWAKKLDWSGYAPRPGRQMFNDCTAWAVCQALSTQLAMAYRRRPTAPNEALSPRFLYLATANGRDAGSPIVSNDRPCAVSVLTAQGCATDGTMPYHPDGLALSDGPSETAIREALSVAGKIEHCRLRSIDEIKWAMTQGIIPILAVKADDGFQSKSQDGNYRWSKSEEWTLHAICAVGYDDERRAIKVMNSYGEDWKDGGFCWVDYDQFVYIDNSELQWCSEAHTIRLLFASAPTRVSTRVYRLHLSADGSVSFDGQPGRGPIADAGFAHAVAATSSSAYALCEDGTVRKLVIADDGSRIYGWDEISSGPLPQGLNNEQVNIIAATPNHLYALTTKKAVFARIPGQLGARVWSEIGAPPGDQVQSIRAIDGILFCVGQTGNTYRRDPGSWTPAQLPAVGEIRGVR